MVGNYFFKNVKCEVTAKCYEAPIRSSDLYIKMNRIQKRRKINH
jgi:hypothetical protein